MLEQNIAYIERYLRDNSNFPPEQLRETLVGVGYHEDEINAAFDRATGKVSGVSRELAEEAPSPPPIVPSVSAGIVKESSRPTWLLPAAGGALLLLAAIGTAVYFLLVRENGSESDALSETTLSSEEVASSSDTTPESSDFNLPAEEAAPTTYPDALQSYATALTLQDYRITTSGILKNIPNGTTLDLNQRNFYLKKGVLVRSETTQATGPSLFIAKNGKVYDIQSSKKMFSEYDMLTEMGKAKVSGMTEAFPVAGVLLLSAQGLLDWKKESEGVWVSEWKGDERSLSTTNGPLFSDGTTVIGIRVVLQPLTNLMTSMSLRYGEAGEWQEVRMTHEPVANIDELMKFPLDFKKAN